jgi:DNA-binding transcriptional ArsR family regulator
MSHLDNKVFKALGCSTRLQMLEILSDSETHITGMAKKLGISVPVAAKHVKILEEAELVNRKRFGKTDILKINTSNIYTILDRFAPSKSVDVDKGTTLLDALKKVSAVEVKQIGDRDAVVATDGDQGFYVYEVDGNFSDKTVNECTFDKDATVKWKKLEPITKMKLNINIKKE